MSVEIAENQIESWGPNFNFDNLCGVISWISYTEDPAEVGTHS